MEVTAMMDSIEASRLAGAARRIARAPEKLDRDFLNRADGSLARFLFRQSGDPGENARKLVAVGLVDPNDPCALALQEEGDGRRQDVTDMKSREGLIRKSAELAQEISKSATARDVLVGTAALRRRIGGASVTHEDVAVGFEKIARKAAACGCDEDARRAGTAFAAAVVAGVGENERHRAAAPARRSSERIM